MSDGMPIPFPGDDRAERLDDGGWSLDESAEPADWENPDEPAEAFCGESGPLGWVCSRPKRHRSVWHVAEVEHGRAVAVWGGPRTWALPTIPEDVKAVRDAEGHVWTRQADRWARRTGVWTEDPIAMLGRFPKLSPLTEVLEDNRG